MSCNTPIPCLPEPCPILLSTDCVYYSGAYLPELGLSPNIPLTDVLVKIIQSIDISGGQLVPYTPGVPYKLGDQVYFHYKIWGCVIPIPTAPIEFNPLSWEIIVNKEFTGTTAERQALLDFPYLGQPFWDTDLQLPLYYVAGSWYNSAGGLTL